MRRICALLLTLLLLPLGVAQALQLPKLSPREPQTITLWTYYAGEQKRAFDVLVEEFNATVGYEKGIVVVAESKGSIGQLSEMVLASVRRDPGAEAAPDMFLSYADSAYELAVQGSLAPFGEYLEQKELDQYVGDFLREGDVLGDGSVYLLPVAKATEVLVVNATYVEAFLAEHPQMSWETLETWPGLMDLAQAYYDWTAETQGQGQAFLAVDSMANLIVTVYQQAGEEALSLRDGQGLVHVYSPAFEAVWKDYYMPMVSGSFASLGRFGSDDLKTGDVAAFVGSTSSTAYLPDEIVNADGITQAIEIRVLPVPVFLGDTPATVQQGAGLALMHSTPEREYACALFASWFTAPEQNLAFAHDSGYLPVRQDTLEQLGHSLDTRTHLSTIEQAQHIGIEHILQGYQLYATTPFAGAFEARSLLAGLKDEAIEAARQRGLRVEAGESPEDVLADLTSPERMRAFQDRVAGQIQALGVLVE